MEKGARSAPGAPPPLAFSLLALSTCDVTVCGASPVPSCPSPPSCRLLIVVGGGGVKVRGGSRSRCSERPLLHRSAHSRGTRPQATTEPGEGRGLREGAAPSLRWPAAPAQGRWVGGGVGFVNLLAAGVKAVLFPSLGMGGASGFFPS